MNRKIEVYRNSTLYQKLDRQIKKHIFGGKTVVAFTDIDGTYISTFTPHNMEKIRNFTPYPAIIEFQRMRFKQATQALTYYLVAYSIPIIAVTGRKYFAVREGQSSGSKYTEEYLPNFDVIASSVGTRLYVLQKGELHNYQQDDYFDQTVAQTSGFNHDLIYRTVDEFRVNINNKFPDLKFTFQPGDQQTKLFQSYDGVNICEPYKISCICRKDVISNLTIETLFKNWLTANGFSHLEVTVMNTSSDIYVDVVPFGKDRCIKYLMSITNADIGVVAGDSGNDKLMILNAPSAAIVPGGASEELVQIIQSVPRIKSMEYYYMLPNGVPIYVEPREAKYNEHIGPESLQMAFATYLSHLIAYQKSVV